MEKDKNSGDIPECGDWRGLASLFVYGTLKRGFALNSALQSASFAGSAITVDKLPMEVRGRPFPFLYNMPGRGRQVRGEVYTLDDDNLWAKLDRIESHPHFYRRSVIQVILDGESKPRPAWVYFVNRRAWPHGSDFSQAASVFEK